VGCQNPTCDLPSPLRAAPALKRCYFSDYRFSEDLDFTLREPLTFEDIRARLERIYAVVQEASGITFTFAREDRQPHVNSHTFYLHYTGPLPAGNDVKVDITINERMVFPLQQRPTGYEGDRREIGTVNIVPLWNYIDKATKTHAGVGEDYLCVPAGT